MRFRLQTDYALRALMFMATKNGGNCTTDEIAGYYRISSAHLGRVIRRLQGHGYVKAIRGRKGGVRLAKDPLSFTVGEVVNVLEQGAQPLDQAKSPCEEMDRMDAALRRAHHMFLNYLTNVNFAELAKDGLPPVPTAGTVHVETATPVATPVAAPVPVLAGASPSSHGHSGSDHPFGLP